MYRRISSKSTTKNGQKRMTMFVVLLLYLCVPLSIQEVDKGQIGWPVRVLADYLVTLSSDSPALLTAVSSAAAFKKRTRLFAMQCVGTKDSFRIQRRWKRKRTVRLSEIGRIKQGPDCKITLALPSFRSERTLFRRINWLHLTTILWVGYENMTLFKISHFAET